MRTLVILGITPFSKLVKEIVEADGRSVAAYTVNREYLPEQKEDGGTPIFALEDLKSRFENEAFEVLVTVGYAQMNESREKVFKICDQYGYKIASFIHSSAQCDAASMGRGNIVMPHCIIHRFAKVGEGNIFVDNTVIGHETEIGNFNFFAGITTGGMAQIGSHCFLGMKSIICNNITVGDYTLLGAGTVLSKSSEANTMVMPAPNRTIKMNPKAMASLLV